jgi:hypothetical protein
MKLATHTPGPWRAEACDSDEFWFSNGYFAVRAGNRTVAPVGIDNDNMSESAANARLIAAAPDLLAFAQAFVELDRLVSRDDIASGINILLEQARAAIAKAEGNG